MRHKWALNGLEISYPTYPSEKNYDYCNSWNLIKTTIIVIISRSGQGKTYVEYEAGKNSLVARRVDWKSEKHGIV